MCYFPDVFKVEVSVNEQDWPEEEFMAATARKLDQEARQEVVASKHRVYWAKDILLKAMWTRIKLRKDVTRWFKHIVLENFRKVMGIREILDSFVRETAVDIAEKK